MISCQHLLILKAGSNVVMDISEGFAFQVSCKNCAKVNGKEVHISGSETYGDFMLRFLSYMSYFSSSASSFIEAARLDQTRATPDPELRVCSSKAWAKRTFVHCTTCCIIAARYYLNSLQQRSRLN